jgi:hypothetical protein
MVELVLPFVNWLADDCLKRTWYGVQPSGDEEGHIVRFTGSYASTRLDLYRLAWREEAGNSILV